MHGRPRQSVAHIYKAATVRLEGNAAKRVVTSEPAPWSRWRVKDRAARCIRFVETFCRPAKGHRAGASLELAGFQREWLERVLAPGVRVAVQSLPRGNGKSTLLAAVACWGLFDADESGGAPQVPVVATTLRQIERSVYNVALAMIDAEPELQSRALVFSGIGTQRVRTPHNGGEMFPVSADLAGLQGLDPSLAVVDECGFLQVESFNALVLASGKRPRSLVVGIGTPGVDRENALWNVRKMVAEGSAPAGFRFSEFAAPDGCALDDRDAWAEANPALAGGFMSADALETTLALATEAEFRIYRLGQWAESTEGGWLADGDIEACVVEGVKIPKHAQIVLAFDGSDRLDASALVACSFDTRPVLELCGLWENVEVPIAEVEDRIRAACRRWDVVAVAFDPYRWRRTMQVLEAEGLPVIEFPQSPSRMVPATQRLFAAIKERAIAHDGQPDFVRHFRNCRTWTDYRGTRVRKRSPMSPQKIDIAVASIMAHDLAATWKPAEVLASPEVILL
jgi:phage terminase large subunit-like protein